MNISSGCKETMTEMDNQAQEGLIDPYYIYGPKTRNKYQ